MSHYDDSDREPSPVRFAPPPDDNSDSSSAISAASIHKVDPVLGSRYPPALPKVKRRPPALQRRSSSTDSYQRSKSIDILVKGGIEPPSAGSGLGISVSSTIYPNSAIGAHSFIDLDDATPSPRLERLNRRWEGAPADACSINSLESSEFYVRASHLSNPNAMYPTPTRGSFRPHSRADTVRSDTSQLPMFTQPDAGVIPYQPVTTTERRRPRPQSMILSPTSTADGFFNYTDTSEPSRLKPPLPKGPKPPLFLRKAAAASSSPSSPKEYSRAQQQSLPPTTNTRGPSERQELVRKHRKLAQMFGEGVTGMLCPNDDLHGARTRVRGPVPPSSHRKGSLSADTHDDGRGDQLLIIGPVRRHSTPTNTEFGDYAKMVRNEQGDNNTRRRRGSGSPESFMELSDDECDARRGDDVSSVLSHNPEVTAEQERKKMRDKLAKLHRFLGSRVPVELALGAEYALKDQDLPKPAPMAVSPASDREGDMKDGGKKWKRRRRSSSSAALPGYVVVPSATESREPPEERIKDELDERERALNLKRANKMEQMFGTRPPPTLYQTRPAPRSLRLIAPLSEPFPLPVVELNPNVSAYKGKSRYKRPATSDSSRPLLADDRSGLFKRPGTSDSSRPLLGEDRGGSAGGMSSVYMYYRHSLNSLTDIIDHDDKVSLAELHQYINGNSSSDEESTPVPPASSTASIVPGPSSLERRRSLPARTSLLSIASSMISVPPPTPDPGAFQQRRRRAAKLTNFFGVNYRDLFGDVLDSIEMGMREEVFSGSMRAEELEELLGKLRTLKVRRDEIV